MSLPVVNLDDRTFQDIVDDAKRRLQQRCPSWSDHNVSDPGVTLIELFAWMTEMVLYRLNQVPEKHYIKLMELMGLRLKAPAAAETEITFYLSSPRPEDFLVPPQTEVATRRTEIQDPIIFSTNEALLIRPADKPILITETLDPATHTSVYQRHNLADRPAEIFHDVPRSGDALYFGFQTDLSHHILQFEVQCQQNLGLGVDPDDPPWQWAVWKGDQDSIDPWQPVAVESDETGGFNQSGTIRLRLPQMTKQDLGLFPEPAYWLRCRVANSERGRYDSSPRVEAVRVESWGGTVKATHAATIHQELLGQSDGTPGQVFYLEYGPILARRPGETIEIRTPDSKMWESWQEVSNFADSDPDDQHFTCDSTNGAIGFGPALSQGDGSVRSYGLIPPRKAEIRFLQYRYGGGATGNVQSGTLTVLKTAIPYVDQVINHQPAEGGLDAESIEQAKLRACQMISTQGRAVTAADFEYLALEADPTIQRAHCLSLGDDSPKQDAADGQVDILLVPQVSQKEGALDPKQLELNPSLVNRVYNYLDQYRLLTVRLKIRQPTYTRVAVNVVLVADAKADTYHLQKDATTKLNEYLNPLTGGRDGRGWPFGRDLYLSDIYDCLRDIKGYELIESVAFQESGKVGDPQPNIGSVTLPQDGLLISGEHHVIVKAANSH